MRLPTWAIPSTRSSGSWSLERVIDVNYDVGRCLPSICIAFVGVSRAGEVRHPTRSASGMRQPSARTAIALTKDEIYGVRMRKTPQIDIVIVSYNSRDELRSCIAPLLEASWINLIVVDNASPDGSWRFLRTCR